MTTTTPRFFHLSPTGRARARLEEAEHYFLAGNLNEALAAAQQAWREHPVEPDVFRVLAYIHMARGEYPPAAEAAYQSVVLDGENPASHASLCQVYVTFSMLQQAEETLKIVLQRFPEDPALLVLAADVRFRRGQTAQAVEAATLALAKNPHDAYAKALLGTHYLQKKRFAEAGPLLGEAVQAYPQRWDYLRDYGIALLHGGAYAAARRVLAQSFRLNPVDRQTKPHLLLALRLDRGNAPAYWRLAFFSFRHLGWAWFFYLLGLANVLVGLTWILVLYFAQGALSEYLWPDSLFFGGLALAVLMHGGVALSQRRGKRFDAMLSRAIEAENA